MKIIVFGASGSVGKIVVQQALASGKKVTAFTRNPGVFDSIKNSNLVVRKGDLLNLRDVEEAVKGHDAVVCVIGDGGKGSIRARGTENIIKAMRNSGIRRFICQTTLGLGNSWSNLNFFWKYIMFGMLLKKAFLDHKFQEELIRKSDLDWTIVRPSAFTNGKQTGQFKIGFNEEAKDLKLTISREDVAAFLLHQLASDRYLKKEVSISN